MTKAFVSVIIAYVPSERTQMCWCGSMAEQLICNQQVGGSTPFTSSRFSAVAENVLGEFPSGQRGQTVNLLSLTSVVRIHLPPPEKSTCNRKCFFQRNKSYRICEMPFGREIRLRRVKCTLCVNGFISFHLMRSIKFHDLRSKSFHIERSEIFHLLTG